jgi:hypothetical protein
MRTQHLYFVTLIVSVTIISGCRDASKPSDLPPLYPCTVTITQEGIPFAGASVEFVLADQAQAKYRALAETDENGQGQMRTYGQFGTPSGKYKVVVTKTVQGEPNRYLKDESTGQQEAIGWKMYQTVESKFSSAETTPHEIEITGKGRRVEQTFDVGKAVKVLMPE